MGNVVCPSFFSGKRETPMTGWTKRQVALAIAWVLLWAVVPYLGKLHNGFLLWDDKRFIHEAEPIHSLGNLPQFFRMGQDGLYRPLRMALYAVSYDTLGFGTRPLGYEIVGLLLQAACALFFFLLLRALKCPDVAALAAATVFAAHPIHVERVAGITASYDLLGDALLLWALFLYFRRRDARTYWLWVPVLLASVLSSEMGAVFLPLVICLEAVRARNWRELFARPRLAPLLAAVALVAGYLAVRALVLGHVDRGFPRPAEGFLDNLLTVSTFHAHYLKLFLLPWQTNYFHRAPVVTANSLTGWLCFGALLTLLLAALVWFRRRPWATIGIAWFFVMLLPFSQILPNYPAFQERYAYLPLGGFAIFLGLLADYLWRRLRRRGRVVAILVGACYLAILFQQTSAYTNAFADDLTLWTRTAARDPLQAGAWNNVGIGWMEKGDYAAAIPNFLTAMKLDAKFQIPVRNLALCYRQLDRKSEAYEAILRYLEMNPADVGAADLYYRLTVELGNAADAIAELAAQRKNPAFPDRLLLTLAVAHLSVAHYAEAAEILKDYTARHPADEAAQALLRQALQFH